MSRRLEVDELVVSEKSLRLRYTRYADGSNGMV